MKKRNKVSKGNQIKLPAYAWIVPCSILLLYGSGYLLDECGLKIYAGSKLWISVTASLLAGYFTLIGVRMTIFSQQKVERE